MTYSSPLSQPCRTGQHGHCTYTGQCQCGCHDVVTAAPAGRDLTRAQLVDRLNGAVRQLDQLASFLVALAESQGTDPMRMQYPSGEPAMAPIVTAQAQVLAALAQLEAAP